MVTPNALRDFFAGVLSDLDANPREMKIRLTFESEKRCMIDIVDGNPVFCVGEETLKANFRRRWLPEHPVPLNLHRGMVLKFTPTTGNRIKVNRQTISFSW